MYVRKAQGGPSRVVQLYFARDGGLRVRWHSFHEVTVYLVATAASSPTVQGGLELTVRALTPLKPRRR